MNLGIVITDVTSFANTTLAGLALVVASWIGLRMAIKVVRVFVH